MKVEQFFENVNQDPELQGSDIIVDENPERCAFVVEELRSGSRWKTRFSLQAVCGDGWNRLRALALAEVPPNPLIHITRIVGYFSSTDNWNKSKLGELADRRKAVEHYANLGQVKRKARSREQ